MKISRKIGLAAFIITETIFIIILIIGCMMVFQNKAKFEDLMSLGLYQTGILTVVWGSQAGVNMIKNKNGMKNEESTN